MAQSSTSFNQVQTELGGSVSPGRATDTGQVSLLAAAQDSLNDGGLIPHFSWSSDSAGYASGSGVGILIHSNSFFTGVIGVDIDGGTQSFAGGAAFHRNIISVSSTTLPNGTPVDFLFTTTGVFTSSTNLQGDGFNASAAISMSLGLSNVTGGNLVGVQCGSFSADIPECGNGFTTSQVIHTVVGGQLLLDVELGASADTGVFAPNPASPPPYTTGAIASADGFHSVTWTLDAVTPGVTYTTASGETYVSNPTVGPTATAFAIPNILDAGSPTTLMASIHLPANSTSTGIGVTADLSSIGGGSQVSLFDDGTHGDATAGDNIFTLATTVAPGTSGGLKSLPAIVFDAQGRSNQTLIAISINAPLDNIPPTTSKIVSSSPNSAGWNNTNVTVSLSATDNTGGSGVQQFAYAMTGAQTGSAVANSTVVIPFTVEGVTTLTYFATDNIGNQEALQTLVIRIDKTLPTLTATQTPLPNAAGWNKTSVTVSFQCSDALSGLAAGSPSAPVTIPTNGNGQSANGTCVDLAGNGVLLTVQPINIDTIAPLVIAPPSQTVQQSNATGAIVKYPNPSIFETGSGIAASGCDPVSGGNFPVGTTPVTCFATDRAGNTGATSFTITVTPVHRKFPKG